MGCLSSANTAGKERFSQGWLTQGFLVLCLVLLGAGLFSNTVLAQSTSPNIFTPPDCSNANATTNPDCAWLLAKMEGSLFNGVTPIEGIWSYRYDRSGMPTYIDHRHANGQPANKTFYIYQSKDQPLFEQNFEGTDPNNPGGILKTQFALSLFHPPQGSPHPGKIQYKIGMALDATNMAPGGAANFVFFGEIYNYPNPGEMEVEKYYYAFNPGAMGFTSIGRITEWYLLDDQDRVTQLIKEESSLAHAHRVDIINFDYGQNGLRGVYHGWNDCNLSPSHCGKSSNNKAELTGGNAQNFIITEMSFDSEGRIKFWTSKEDHGPNPGDLRDLTFDKEVECWVTYEDNQVPIYHLPKILKDLGFTDTGLPSSIACDTTLGGSESLEVTLQWAPRWRFNY